MTRPQAESAPVSTKQKSSLLNFGLFALGMALLGWSIYSNRVKLRQSLSGELHYSWMLEAFLLHFTAVIIAFLRWFGLVRLLGIKIPLADSLRLSFVGNLFNLIIPGAVGGDLVKAGYLARMDIPRTRVIASMVIDRLLGLLGLFLMATLAGLSAWPSSDTPVRRLTITVLISTTTLIIFLALVFSGLIGRNSPKMAELNAMSNSYRSHLPAVLAWTLASVLVHSLNTLAFYRMSLAILPELNIGVSQHFQIVPLVLFSTAVPLPFGALGLSENISSQLFKHVSHPDGAIAMMGFRLLQYGFAAIAALVYWANIKSMKHLTEQKWD
ncbi:MAG: UPF0104 family protein [Planctomycetota bacterium]|nr:MAG: UPF0104 family protein [Planctomycetota bacterium]